VYCLRDANDPDYFAVLVAELKAIEVWNSAYWRKLHPDRWDEMAYEARSERRAEILSQLVDLKSNGEEENRQIRKSTPFEARS
jgi:hypothetical protein